VAYHAADTLTAAHAAGIVHRDVKPENLFLTRDGVLKVLDFGVARLLERSARAGSEATQQGVSVGTPGFMPPEQARGRWDQVDGRSDVWSLGATMFSLISGNWVHEGETVAEQVILAATKPPRSIMEVSPDTPMIVAAIVDQALSYQPRERFTDMGSMRQAIQNAAMRLESEQARLPRISSSNLAHEDGAEPIRMSRPFVPPPALADAVDQDEVETGISGIVASPESARAASLHTPLRSTGPDADLLEDAVTSLAPDELMEAGLDESDTVVTRSPSFLPSSIPPPISSENLPPSLRLPRLDDLPKFDPTSERATASTVAVARTNGKTEVRRPWGILVGAMVILLVVLVVAVFAFSGAKYPQGSPVPAASTSGQAARY